MLNSYAGLEQVVIELRNLKNLSKFVMELFQSDQGPALEEQAG